MLRAGSLIYAIGIALILAILSGSLILLAFNTRTAVDSDLLAEKQIRNVSSALNYYLTNSEQWREKNKLDIDLFQINNDSVVIEREQWGLLEIVNCQAHQGYKKAAGIYLVGLQPGKERTALYLADNGKPLSLCGKTIIKGNSFIPPAGVKFAYIEGQNFIGTKLIDGKTENSSAGLPDLDKEIPTLVTSFSAGLTDNLLEIETLESNKTLSNSFGNRTLIINAKGDLDLDNYQLLGNIIIRCEGKVVVKESSMLQDILIEAGSIVIEKRFSGTFQGFARDSIILGDEAHLNYPSTLCIVANLKVPGSSKIVLNRSCKVQGLVVNFNRQDVINKTINIDVAEGVNITGLLYSNGVIGFKGTVIGSLYCSGFMLKTPSAVYENHLLNAVINSAELPDYFVGAFPPTGASRKALIKRLE